MKNSVVIKSYPNGINLILNPDVPFEELLKDIAEKFNESRSFFKQASMALSLEGRTLTDLQEIMILEAIMANSDLHIMCIVGRDEDKNKNFIKALDQTESRFHNDSEGKIYKGNVSDGQCVESKTNLFIMGDVNPGCRVLSDKSIIVLGGLYGEAVAGLDQKGDSVVIALEMEPEKLLIGDFKYKNSKSGKWSIRQKIQPKIAYLSNEKVLIESLTKELLRTLWS